MVKCYLLPRRRSLCLFLLLFCASAFSVFAQEDVQLAIPGEFTDPYTFLNEFTDGTIDVDDDGSPDIVQPCTCTQNPPITNGESAEGWFLDQVVVATGISGEVWLVENALNAFLLDEDIPVFPGDTLQEIGTTGVYVLPIRHRSAQQYSVLVEAPNSYPGLTLGPVSARCFYPTPFIENLDSVYCSFEEAFPLTVDICTGVGCWLEVIPETESWLITRLDDGMTWTTPSFSPTDYGPGDYRIEYTVFAGSDPYNAYHSTGCETIVEDTVRVEASQAIMACNGLLNISVGVECERTIPPALLLAGTPTPGATFEIHVYAPDGTDLGDQVSAIYDGQTLTAEIIDGCTGSACTSALLIRDLEPPALTIPADVDLTCIESEHPDETGYATAIDCNDVSVTYTDQVWEDECADPTIVITRTWRAEDTAGNVTIDDQVIRIYRAGPTSFLFPPDIVIPCDQYILDPSLTDPTPEGAGMPTLVDEPRCRLLYTFVDDTINSDGYDFVILREWVMLDLCGANIYEIDAAGEDNMQFIRVADQVAPELVVEPSVVSANQPPPTLGGQCYSLGFVAPPVSVEDCSGVTVRIFTPVGEAEYVDGVSGLSGGFIPEPGLPLGEFELVYEAIDERGNTEYYTTTVTVIDNLPPVMICNSELNVTLQPDGQARIYPDDIDEGSRDDCCTDVLKVKLGSEPDEDFRDFIDFDCQNGPIDVVLRLWDCAGNFNNCIASITVQDVVPVTIVSTPSPVTITCLDDYQDYLTQNFDAPAFADNCGFEVVFGANELIDDCGSGQIIRTWTATDNPDNPPATVVQTVTVEPFFDYRVAIPADNEFVCGDPFSFNDMELLSSDGCEMTAITAVIDTLSSSEDGCYRLARTHQLINWCLYDENDAPTILPRLDGADEFTEVGDAYEVLVSGTDVFSIISGNQDNLGTVTGYYLYTQIITVFDELAPVIQLPPPIAACLSDFENCTTPVTIPFSIVDECFFEVEFSYQIRRQATLFGPDTIGQLLSVPGGWEIQGFYPAGEYTLLFTASDACGNMSEEELLLYIQDCEAPTLQCYEDDLVWYLPDTNGIVIQPEDLLITAFDDCSGLSLSIEGEASVTFGCDDLGTQALTVYALDDAGQQTNCTVEVLIADTTLACTPNLTIEGFVRREDGEGVAGVGVSLLGPMAASAETDLEGYYQFTDLPPGEDYTIVPSKDINHPNGVTTLDIIRVSKHILFVAQLDTPYKLIAADANRSGSITTIDLIRMRKIILNVDSLFADNTSWRFVPTDYEFPNEMNPWTETFPERVVMENVVQSEVIDFMAVKTGDVNNSALTEPFSSGEDQRSSYLLPTEDKMLRAGELVDLTITAPAASLAGGQVSVEWATNALQFKEVRPTTFTNIDHYNLAEVDQGLLSTCWYDEAQPGERLLQLRFQARQNGLLSDFLWLGQRLIKSEVYTAYGGDDYDIFYPVIQWENETQTSTFTPLMPYPNPGKGDLHFPLQLGEGGWGTLVLRDAHGSTIYQAEQFFDAGQNTWTVPANRLQTYRGVLWYELRLGELKSSGRIVRLE